MKPSERIKEIREIVTSQNNVEMIPAWLISIEKYLDEEHEKNKPCEHEPDGEILSNGAHYCKKCRVMYVI